MPRIGVIIGITHKGDTEVISPESVPYTAQVADYRELRSELKHDRFARIYHVDLSLVPCLRLRSPKDHKEHEQRRADELAAAATVGKKVVADNKAQAAAALKHQAKSLGLEVPKDTPTK